MKLPKEIYVTIEDAGSDDEYLNAQRSIKAIANSEETKTVGRYVLLDVRSVAMQTVEGRISKQK